MKAVFFGEELHVRAPLAVGTILADDGRWMGLAEVAEVLAAGGDIVIRQATAGELRRAAAFVEVFETGARLSELVKILYQNQGDYAVSDAIFNLHQAVVSANFADIALVDSE